MFQKIKTLSNHVLTERLRTVSTRERQVTAEVVVHIAEFMARELYLGHGHTSIFAYLTNELRYSGSTAQARIDAARLLITTPDLEKDLFDGFINLSQTSLIARGIRQFKEENPEGNCKPSDLLSKVKSCTVRQTAIIVAQELDLNLRAQERTIHQKDESVVLEITLTKSQMEDLRRARDLSSHVKHDANWADVISIVTNEYLTQKDPLRDLPVRKRRTKSEPNHISAKAPNFTANSHELEGSKDGQNVTIDFPLQTESASHHYANSQLQSHPRRKAIPASMKREVVRRDKTCQHVDPKSGRRCGSTYQLQCDHIVSVCDGGTNDLENLQLLCGVHNRLKYRQGHERKNYLKPTVAFKSYRKPCAPDS